MRRYGIVKRILDKPIHNMGCSDLFLRIVGACREKLITFTLGIDASKLEGPNCILNQAFKLFCSGA